MELPAVERGTKSVPVTKAVATGQPMVASLPGGYDDGDGTPMACPYGLTETDRSLAAMIQALTSAGLPVNSLFIVARPSMVSRRQPAKVQLSPDISPQVAALPDDRKPIPGKAITPGASAPRSTVPAASCRMTDPRADRLQASKQNPGGDSTIERHCPRLVI